MSKTVAAVLTTAQVLANFGLNWTVEKKPFLFKGGDGEMHESDYFGLVRSDNDTVLGHCKDSYRAFQNQLILETMQAFAKDHGLEVERGGCFGGGKKVFLQLYIPDDMRIGKDEVKQYIFAANTFDHSARLSFGYTNVVISCQNTYNRALKDTSIRIKHTKSGEDRIIELPTLFADHLQLRKETNEMFQVWASKPATKKMAQELIAQLTGTDMALATAAARAEMSTRSRNIMEGLEMSINKEMKEKGDTLWGLFNGITYYANHVKSHPKRDNGQLESILVGTGNQMMTKAQHIITNEFAA
jgi:phage/plasmid-like protein (TIGR03299 family)